MDWSSAGRHLAGQPWHLGGKFWRILPLPSGSPPASANGQEILPI